MSAATRNGAFCSSLSRLASLPAVVAAYRLSGAATVGTVLAGTVAVGAVVVGAVLAGAVVGALVTGAVFGAPGDSAAIESFLSLAAEKRPSQRHWETGEHLRIAFFITWIERTYRRCCKLTLDG